MSQFVSHIDLCQVSLLMAPAGLASSKLLILPCGSVVVISLHVLPILSLFSRATAVPTRCVGAQAVCSLGSNIWSRASLQACRILWNHVSSWDVCWV